jgi:hypothetical protein
MISYDLRCGKDHVFEAWFQNSAAYDEQVAKKRVSCPVCGSTRIEKSIMAPSVARSGGGDLSPQEMKRMLVKLRETVEANCDYVGPDFPEEARKIHYGEADQRSIYGEATAQEASELAEEGIEFGCVPWVERTDS